MRLGGYGPSALCVVGPHVSGIQLEVGDGRRNECSCRVFPVRQGAGRFNFNSECESAMEYEYVYLIPSHHSPKPRS